MIINIIIVKENIKKEIILRKEDNDIFSSIFNMSQEAVNIANISIPYKDINGDCGFILTNNIFSIDIINENSNNKFIPKPLKKESTIDYGMFT